MNNKVVGLICRNNKEKVQEEVFCKCGCGKKKFKYDKNWVERLYIYGHNTKGKNYSNRKGHKHSEAEKIKYGKSIKKWWDNNKGSEVVKERNRKIGEKNKVKLKGRKLSQEHKDKVVQALKINTQSPKRIVNLGRGETHYNWQGGISRKNDNLRKSNMWRTWRKAVFERDNYICQNKVCSYCQNKKGITIHPHHIKPISKFPELSFDINNGVTYCEDFHLKSGLHKNSVGAI